MTTTFIPDDNTGGGFTIVTRVIPAQPAPAGTGLYAPVTEPRVFSSELDGNLGNEDCTPGPVKNFLKRHPKELGTVQILTAVVTLLLGIILTLDADTLSVRSLIVYWGAGIYFSAGCLSVTATKKPHACVMKCLLGTNMVSTITSGVAVVLLSLDLAYGPGNSYGNMYDICTAFKKQTNGISGVLLAFSLLQFNTSICMALFGCDVICCTDPLVPINNRGPNHGAQCSLFSHFPAHSNQQGIFLISNTSMNNPLLAHPPEYSETESPFQPLHQQTTSGPVAAGTECNISGI